MYLDRPGPNKRHAAQYWGPVPGFSDACGYRNWRHVLVQKSRGSDEVPISRSTRSLHTSHTTLVVLDRHVTLSTRQHGGWPFAISQNNNIYGSEYYRKIPSLLEVLPPRSVGPRPDLDFIRVKLGIWRRTATLTAGSSALCVCSSTVHLSYCLSPRQLLLIRGPASPSDLISRRLRHVVRRLPCVTKRSPVDAQHRTNVTAAATLGE